MKDQHIFDLLSDESKQIIRKLNPSKKNLRVLPANEVLKALMRNDNVVKELLNSAEVGEYKAKKIQISDWLNFAYHESYLNGFESIEKFHLVFSYLLLVDIEKYYQAKKLVLSKAGFDVDISEQSFIQDLTEVAKKLAHPYVGREKEMTKLIVNLSSQNEDRPTLLLGESGTGKTGMMLELAKRINIGQVPSVLLGTRVLRVRFGAMVNSFSPEKPKLQGDFFSRLFTEIFSNSKYRGNVILFLDDLRIGTNFFITFGPINKRAGISVVGAAQNDINEKFWESPLSKSWNIITMEEQSDEEYYTILRQYADQIEDAGNSKFSNEVIHKIIQLYKSDLILEGMPGEGIKLLEQLAIYKRHKAYDYSGLSGKIQDLKNSPKTRIAQEGAMLEEKIVEMENFKIVIEPKDLMEYVDTGEGDRNIVNLTIDKKKISDIESNIKKLIIGQNEAIEALVRALRISSLKLSSDYRPIGTFLFLGPTGVGKSETAKILARTLFNNGEKTRKMPTNFLRIDMTEFSEKHSVSRLFGAPPGYIGYDDSTSLADFLILNPSSIVLFDEIEKADPNVINSLLHVMDEGEIRNNKAEIASLEDCIIIMTSNLGAELINQQNFGYLSKKNDDWKAKLTENLKHKLKPEFLNRFDEIIVFNKLDKASVEIIANQNLDILIKKLKEINVDLTINKKSFDKLISEANSEEYGAREIRRVIRKEITDNISKLLLENSDIKEIQVTSVNPWKIKTSNGKSK